MSDKHADQWHRLETYPSTGTGKDKYIVWSELLRGPASPLLCAKAVAVLEAYKATTHKTNPVISQVNITTLIPTQRGVFVHKIKKDIKSGKLDKPILLWQHRGKLYILDGHHRCAAALLLGTPFLRAIWVT
jgi:hypothetical protein